MFSKNHNNNKLRSNKDNKLEHMDKKNDSRTPPGNITLPQRQKTENIWQPTSTFQNQNKESFYQCQWETKASSHLSSSAHETSFDFSESSAENEQLHAQDFFRNDFVFQRKVTKKQLAFRQTCLSQDFVKHVEQLLYKFVNHPTKLTFQFFLQNFKKGLVSIFSSQELKPISNNSSILTFKQTVESLIFQRKNWFFIYTFDLLVCHLTFFLILINYWLDVKPTGLSPKSVSMGKNEDIDSKMSIRHNIVSIIKAYVKSHPQQISQNQGLFLVAIYFLDTLKMSNPSQCSTISTIQKELVRDVKIFRKIQKKDRSFMKSNSEMIFEQKLFKYERDHLFITYSDFTFNMIRSHVIQNFSSELITKYYQFDPEARKSYQLKKDSFCLWVLETIIKEGEGKSTLVLRNASMYIVQIMGMLKKFKKQNSIEAISYLLPIVVNLKDFLPKVWRHIVKRRPQIEARLSQYTQFLLKNKYNVEQLGQDGVIWGETIYTISQKMTKSISLKKGIDLSQHQRFYDIFLSQIMYYRHRAKQIVEQPAFLFTSESEASVGFNLNLLENYLVRKSGKQGLFQSWKELSRRATRINDSISESVLTDIFDYWFYGSTERYQKVDL